MRAFLSHSSVDKEVVIQVHDAFERDSTWIDRAEIEWGQLFLERIAEGITSATDFVLFWSKAAARSEWVRLEVNMAFIQALRRKAIRLRVVILDNTALPLYLQPFQAFSVVGSKSPSKEIIDKLAPLLREPVRSARSRFINRHDEFARIESAVDDPNVQAIWMFGFIGIGKSSVIDEALRRTFEGADAVRVDVTSGTGPVELALALNALARRETLAEGLSLVELDHQIRLSVERIAKDQRLLIVSNVQHWLDEDGGPQGPLVTLLTVIRKLSDLAGHPVFLTSTRRPWINPTVLAKLALIHMDGLANEHIATLVRNWYFSIYGKELQPDDAKRIAPKLFGHPVAARLVAGLLGSQSVDFLEKYPREIIALRRDLARVLLQGINLNTVSERFMETLALADTPLPASIIVSTGFNDDEFQEAVSRCASAGLVTADRAIQTHPLFREFYWHRLHRSNYRERAMKLAEALSAHLGHLEKTSAEFISLLPVTFRSYALAGELEKAKSLRRDLSGELEASAITLYNRRNYDLADQYISHLLDNDPTNWRMRLYRARIRIRQAQWSEADEILRKMLDDRPDDIGVLHAMGWQQLRQNHPKDALEIFTRVIARREHVASLRDAAECLHRLRRNDEALKFLARAKERESENPFVLDLESQILEEMDKLEPAFESALLASARDPLNSHLHTRLGVIRSKQKRPDLAIPFFQKAAELDRDVFSPVNSWASACLDLGDTGGAEGLIPQLVSKARTPSDSALLEHTKARIAFARNDPEKGEELLRKEINRGRNVIPNLGLLVRIECALFDRDRQSFPAHANVALKSAEDALAKIIELDPGNRFIPTLKASVIERKK